MTDFVKAVVLGVYDKGLADSVDESRVSTYALKRVLPVVIENELTPRQRECLTMACIEGLSQEEIALRLRLSQPTVSRHIKTAKDIVNKILSYCFFTVSQANEQWLKMT